MLSSIQILFLLSLKYLICYGSIEALQNESFFVSFTIKTGKNLGPDKYVLNYCLNENWFASDYLENALVSDYLVSSFLSDQDQNDKSNTSIFFSEKTFRLENRQTGLCLERLNNSLRTSKCYDDIEGQFWTINFRNGFYYINSVWKNLKLTDVDSNKGPYYENNNEKWLIFKVSDAYWVQNLWSGLRLDSNDYGQVYMGNPNYAYYQRWNLVSVKYSEPFNLLVSDARIGCDIFTLNNYWSKDYFVESLVPCGNEGAHLTKYCSLETFYLQNLKTGLFLERYGENYNELRTSYFKNNSDNFKWNFELRNGFYEIRSKWKNITLIDQYPHKEILNLVKEENYHKWLILKKNDSYHIQNFWSGQRLYSWYHYNGLYMANPNSDDYQRWRIIPSGRPDYKLKLKVEDYDQKTNKPLQIESQVVNVFEDIIISNQQNFTNLEHTFDFTKINLKQNIQNVKIGIKSFYSFDYFYVRSLTESKSCELVKHVKVPPLKTIKCNGWFDIDKQMHIPIEAKVSITASGDIFEEDGSTKSYRLVDGARLANYLRRFNFQGKILDVKSDRVIASMSATMDMDVFVDCHLKCFDMI